MDRTVGLACEDSVGEDKDFGSCSLCDLEPSGGRAPIERTTRNRRRKGGEAIAITLGGRQQVRTTGNNGENDGS